MLKTCFYYFKKMKCKFCLKLNYFCLQHSFSLEMIFVILFKCVLLSWKENYKLALKNLFMALRHLWLRYDGERMWGGCRGRSSFKSTINLVWLRQNCGKASSGWWVAGFDPRTFSVRINLLTELRPLGAKN